MVRQFWESLRDEGKTWSVAFDGVYHRKGNGEKGMGEGEE